MEDWGCWEQPVFWSRGRGAAPVRGWGAKLHLSARARQLSRARGPGSGARARSRLLREIMAPPAPVRGAFTPQLSLAGLLC